MKKYLPYHILIVILFLANHQAMAQATIYVGLTYDIGAKARADRQIYDVKTTTFDNQFGVDYPFAGNIGYLAGIGNDSFSVEYRVSESFLKIDSKATSLFHNNIVLAGRSPIGSRRPKVGIGIGNARSAASGDRIVSTDKSYRTTTYLIGYDFLLGGSDFNSTRHGFTAEYQSVIARSGTFREVEIATNTDVSVRETIRFTQFVLAYTFRFGTTR